MERTWFTPIWAERMKWLRPTFFVAWAACMGVAAYTQDNVLKEGLVFSAIGFLAGYAWLWAPVYLNTCFKGHGLATFSFNRVIIVSAVMILSVVVSREQDILLIVLAGATTAYHFLLKHKVRIWRVLDWEYEQKEKYRKPKD